MSKMSHWKAYSQALYDTDPMGTCCKENGCTDEYDAVARSLDALLGEGVPLLAALMTVLVDYFSEALVQGCDLAPARKAIQEMSGNQ
ncbi:hypothetical protein [Alcanivorax sp.]|uniref:hypothetical protein n=1 Tax=Alcanivorax sp. TaxID=1872427 RepID=UPI0025C6F5EF|nr:hypothetical protein [Alcanivorax sp.]